MPHDLTYTMDANNTTQRKSTLTSHGVNIAIIVRRLNVKGGTQRQALSLAVELKKRGHTVRVYTFLFDPASCYEELLQDMDVFSLGNSSLIGNDGVKRKCLPDRSFIARIFFSFHTLREENRMARELARHIDTATDILNPHDQASYQVAYYAKKRLVGCIPSVWMMNDLPLRLFSYYRDREVGDVPQKDRLETLILLSRKFFGWLIDQYEIRHFIKAQDAVLVLDNRDRTWAERYFHKPARVVRSGISLSGFPYKESTDFPKGRMRVLMTGVFFPHRRFEDGIEALKILRDKGHDVSLTIIGKYNSQDPYFKKLCDTVRECEVENEVIFAGVAEEDNLARTYRAHDIFLFPSHLQSWGIAVFEAMASGLPVIVSKTSGAAEILTHGVDSFLVEPKLPEEIAESICRLIANPELYHSMRKRGRAFVEKNISWTRYTDELEEIFENVYRTHLKNPFPL